VYAGLVAGRIAARKAGRVRSGGFPCRYPTCRECFVVYEESSMAALVAASERRSQHEIGVHDYHHKRLEEHPRGTHGASLSAPRKAK
jgi:hypothetical protein